MDKLKPYIYKFTTYIYDILEKILIFLQKQFAIIMNFIGLHFDEILVIHSVPVENSFLWWVKTYVYIFLPMFFFYLYYKTDWFQPHWFRKSPKTKFEKYVQLEFTELHLWVFFILTMGLINRYTMTYWGNWDVYHQNSYVLYNFGEEYYDKWHKQKMREWWDEEWRLDLVRTIIRNSAMQRYVDTPTHVTHYPNWSNDFHFWNKLQYGKGSYCFTTVQDPMHRFALYGTHIWRNFFWMVEGWHRRQLLIADTLAHCFFLYIGEGERPKLHYFLSDEIYKVESDLWLSKHDFRKNYFYSIPNVIKHQQHYYAQNNTSESLLYKSGITPSYYWELFLPTLKNTFIHEMYNYFYWSSGYWSSSYYPEWYSIFRVDSCILDVRNVYEWYLFWCSTHFEKNNYSYDVFLSSQYAPILNKSSHYSDSFLIWDYSVWSFF